MFARRWLSIAAVCLPLLLTGCQQRAGAHDDSKTYTATGVSRGSSSPSDGGNGGQAKGKPGNGNQGKSNTGGAGGDANGPATTAQTVSGAPSEASDSGRVDATHGRSVMNPGAPAPKK